MERYTENNGLVQLHYVPSFFLQIPPGESIESVQGFAFVLDCISSLFQVFIPSVGNRALRITNDPSRETPICYRDLSHIELNTEPIYWAQIAYQFSHELCHYCISDAVSDNLRWFEESVCETASLFFVHALGCRWQNNNEQLFTSSGSPFADELKRYAILTARKFTVFDLKDPLIRKQLEADCYDRKRNRYLANLLLPIFVRHPDVWAAVPLLGEIHQPTLEEALDAWILASPAAAQPGLLEIMALF